MYTKVKHPLNAKKYPNVVIIRYSIDVIQDAINLACSIGESIKSTGRTVRIQHQTDQVRLLGWVDDINPETTIFVDNNTNYVEPADAVVLFVSTCATAEDYKGTGNEKMIIGMALPLEETDIQKQLALSDQSLLLRLELLLPEDDPIRVLRSNLRNGII